VISLSRGFQNLQGTREGIGERSILKTLQLRWWLLLKRVEDVTRRGSELNRSLSQCTSIDEAK